VTKTKLARVATVSLAIVAIVSGVGGEVRYGGLCYLGISQILAVCPLGFVERVLVSREWLQQFWGPVAVSVLSVIVLGRVFCAWVCPTVLTRRVFTNKKALKPKRQAASESMTWPPYSSYAVLAGVLIASFWFRFPVFCLICPIGLFFGAIYAGIRFFSIDSPSLELVLFPTMLVLELWVLKSWCRSFCPLGALLSIFGNLNRFLRPAVKADKCLAAKGYNCGVCARACPEGIDLDNDKGGFAPNSCTKCLECSDTCPMKAIEIRLRV
jgi:ferredoxin-type protein NapH